MQGQENGDYFICCELPTTISSAVCLRTTILTTFPNIGKR